MKLVENAPAHVRAISPYLPGKPTSELAREMGMPEASIIKLASNENPLGMSPLAREAAINALTGLERYPDGNGFALKAALAERLGVETDEIVLGNGSNDILELAARAFLSNGRSGVFSQYAFAVYPLAINAAGARCVEVPAVAYGHDLDGMAAAIEADTAVVFVANPNNPTGTFLSGDALEHFLRQVPDHVLVVLDEAYTEYLAPEQRYDSFAWRKDHPNLLISRTFSKAYGLAGLRIGYGVGHRDVVDLLNRVRQPFNVSSVALAAARAALQDLEFLERSAAINTRGMQCITQALDTLGLEWIPSAGNFVTFRVGDAAAVNSALLREGVIVRPIAGYGMPEWLRVSIGLPEENARFIAVLGSVVGKLK